MPLGQHVFISYNHADSVFVDMLTKDIEAAGISVWVDKERVSHSHRSFEASLRDAIDSSFAAILIASPESLKSDYVQGEMDIIRARAVPLIVIWVNGDSFIDTVPTYLTRKNYVDCRGNRYVSNKENIVKELRDLLVANVPAFSIVSRNDNIPRSHLSIIVDEARVAAVLIETFKDIGALLDKLFMTCLVEQYAPYTYGQDWLLVSETIDDYVSRAILPPHYFLTPQNRNWLKTAPSDFMLERSTRWQVVARNTGCMVVVSIPQNKEHLSKDFSRSKWLHPKPLLNAKRLGDITYLERIKPNQVITMFIAKSNHWLFSECDGVDLEVVEYLPWLLENP